MESVQCQTLSMFGYQNKLANSRVGQIYIPFYNRSVSGNVVVKLIISYCGWVQKYELQIRLINSSENDIKFI